MVWQDSVRSLKHSPPQQVSLALKAKAVFYEFGVNAGILNAHRRNIFDTAEGKVLLLASRS